MDDDEEVCCTLYIMHWAEGALLHELGEWKEGSKFNHSPPVNNIIHWWATKGKRSYSNVKDTHSQMQLLHSHQYNSQVNKIVHILSTLQHLH